MDLTTRRVLFFVLLYITFYLIAILGIGLPNYYRQIHPDLSLMLIGLVFTGIAVLLFYLSGVNNVQDNYRNLEISPGALCRGGPYMWQGDSEMAKMCRNLAKSKEGRCEIAAFNCPNGFDGMPKVPLDYSSDSNSNWDGIPCNGNFPVDVHKPTCNGDSICSTIVGEY